MIILPVNHDSFAFSFPMFKFLPFSCIIILAVTSSAVLNINGGSVHPCFVPGIRGRTLNISPLYMLPAIGFP